MTITQSAVLPIRREYEYSHLLKEKPDSPKIPVDVRVFATTCAKAITDSFEVAHYKRLPDALWKDHLEQFIACTILGSRLEFSVAIAAFAVIDAHNAALNVENPRPSLSSSFPSSSSSSSSAPPMSRHYAAFDVEDACFAFLGAYMAAAMAMLGDVNAQATSFWERVTHGEFTPHELGMLPELHEAAALEVVSGIVPYEDALERIMCAHEEGVSRGVEVCEWQVVNVGADASPGAQRLSSIPAPRTPTAQNTKFTLSEFEKKVMRGEYSHEEVMRICKLNMALVDAQMEEVRQTRKVQALDREVRS